MHVLKPVSARRVMDSVVIDVKLFLYGGAGETDVLGNVFVLLLRVVVSKICLLKPCEATCFKCG